MDNEIEIFFSYIACVPLVCFFIYTLRHSHDSDTAYANAEARLGGFLTVFAARLLISLYMTMFCLLKGTGMFKSMTSRAFDTFRVTYTNAREGTGSAGEGKVYAAKPQKAFSRTLPCNVKGFAL